MTKITAKPFLKWAGGKTQIIDEIAKLLPKKIYKTNFTYIEPFVGSGAVLFWMLKNFPTIKTAIINDINNMCFKMYHSSIYCNFICDIKSLKNFFYS